MPALWNAEPIPLGSGSNFNPRNTQYPILKDQRQAYKYLKNRTVWIKRLADEVNTIMIIFTGCYIDFNHIF
jgi:hypothetical protein